MISYNHLAAFLTDITGIPGAWVPAILTILGVGAFIGLSIGGRISDERPVLAVLLGAAGTLVSSILLALLAPHPVAVVPLVLVLGIAGFVLNPAIYARVFAVAAQAPTLAGATAVSAFQLGITAVPAFAAVALATGADITSVAWIGAGLAALTIPMILLDAAITRHRSRSADRHITVATVRGG
jgi:DHA1 family chloramphenicol resistance protein-like MFS transporter